MNEINLFENENTMKNLSLDTLKEEGSMDPDYFMNAVVDPDKSSILNQALEDSTFKKQIYTELTEPPTENNLETNSYLTATLNELGEGDEIEIGLQARVVFASKEFEASTKWAVKKSENGFDVTLGGKLGLGFIKEFATKIPGGQAKANLAALLTKEGHVTFQFPDAQEVQKAADLIGKVAITNSVVVPAAVSMPPIAYVLSTKGSQIPVLGKYLVDVNHIPTINGQLKSIEITDALSLRATGSLEGKLPVKELSHLLKGGINLKASGKLKMGAVLNFEEDNGITLVLRGGAGFKMDLEGKGGVGKYNRIVSLRKNMSSESQVWLEHHYPIDEKDIKNMAQAPLKGMTTLIEKGWRNKELVIRVNNRKDNLLTKSGVFQEMTMRPRNSDNILKGGILNYLIEGDFHKAGDALDHLGVTYNHEAQAYRKCGNKAFGEVGLWDVAKLEGGYEFFDRDVNGDDRCGA
ncbi:hypothetical protein KJ708_13785 [bacterium]|nr:hypothetical protein [bacterium]